MKLVRSWSEKRGTIHEISLKLTKTHQIPVPRQILMMCWVKLCWGLIFLKFQHKNLFEIPLRWLSISGKSCYVWQWFACFCSKNPRKTGLNLKVLKTFPANVYLFKSIILMSLLLTLNRFYILIWYFCYWLLTSKCQPDYILIWYFC